MLSQGNRVVSWIDELSLSDGERVLEQLDVEQTPDVLVVPPPSASKLGLPTTDLAQAYNMGFLDISIVYEQLESLAAKTDTVNKLSTIESDLRHIQPGQLTSERLATWSAELLSQATGRLILSNLKDMELESGLRYVAPGGCDEGAKIAIFAEATEFHNWVSTPAFSKTITPSLNSEELIDNLSYDEARKLLNDGHAISERDSIVLLEGSSVRTIMRQTFGELGNRGTDINAERGNVSELPIVAIRAEDISQLDAYNLPENQARQVHLAAFRCLDDLRVPISSANFTPNRIYIGTGESIDYRIQFRVKQAFGGALDYVFDSLQQQFDIEDINRSETGILRIIGDGLSHSSLVNGRMYAGLFNAWNERKLYSQGEFQIQHSNEATFEFKPSKLSGAAEVASEFVSNFK